MISVDDAVRIQSVLIDKFGGSEGLRDKNMLESALMRPYQIFDNKDLYPTPSEKAAAIIESILINHPFIDGNKRFGYIAMRLTLMDCVVRYVRITFFISSLRLKLLAMTFFLCEKDQISQEILRGGSLTGICKSPCN